MRLIIHRRAREELTQIALRYERERMGLGNRFVDAFVVVAERILQNPELFGLVGKDHRLADLKPFAYGVLFRVKDDEVRIKCIRHHSRHPRFGFGRK